MDSPDSAHILITGLTGSVGIEIIRWLGQWAPDLRISAILRAHSPEDLSARWRGVLQTSGLHTNNGSAYATPRMWSPVAGDVTLPRLGLTGPELASLHRTVTHVIHAAADVRFLASLSELVRVNTAGTGNVLEFARSCPRLRQCAQVSTLFVAGRRTGIIREDELEHDAGFINGYEQSKYDAELLARRFMKEIPLAVYRLGLLPGRESDGFVHRFGAFHQIVRYHDRGLLPTLPGLGENCLDMVPTDWAAARVMNLFLNHFRPGETYHIGGGVRAVFMDEFVAVTNRCLSDSSRGESARAPLALVPLSASDWLLKAAAAPETSRGKRFVRMLEVTVPYGALSRVFDVRPQASDGYVPMREFNNYYPRVVQYCVRTDWGRRSVQPDSVASADFIS